MPYSAEISRANPTCFLFLIDQSGSMADVFPTEGAKRKADGVADAINKLLQNLVIRCAKEEGVRDYFHVGVIGYGASVGPAFGGALSGKELVPISEIANSPVRVEERAKKVDDGAGGLVDQKVRFPIWFDATTGGGTPMCQALSDGKRILQQWLAQHGSSFPPVVIHITDGESTDGDPSQAMRELTSLSTRMHRASFRYRSHRDPRMELRMRIRAIAQVRVRYGYRKIRVLLNREGWKVGKYLIERIYREEGLTLHQRRKRRRRVAEHRRERFHPTGPNQVWSMDFVADQLADGRRFRALTVVDIYTRECLAIESGQKLKGEDVVRTLNRIKISRAAPKMVHCDNGSEFSSQAMDLWAYQNGVRMAFSRPGKPTDNAFVESFNGTFRAECLNAHWFSSLTEAQRIVETWRAEYNESRPHRALGEKTPNEFAKEIAASRDFLGQQTAENSP